MLAERATSQQTKTSNDKRSKGDSKDLRVKDYDLGHDNDVTERWTTSTKKDAGDSTLGKGGDNSGRGKCEDGEDEAFRVWEMDEK